jgi:hypothetical protein
MVEINPAAYAMQEAVLILGPTDDYAGSVSKVELTPTTSQSVFKGLKKAVRVPVSGGTDWTLDFTAAQDWETEDSLSNYMFEHAGESVAYSLEPIDGGTAFTGTVICAPGKAGGTQGSDAATSDYSLTSSVPVKVPAA